MVCVHTTTIILSSIVTYTPKLSTIELTIGK